MIHRVGNDQRRQRTRVDNLCVLGVEYQRWLAVLMPPIRSNNNPFRIVRQDLPYTAKAFSQLTSLRHNRETCAQNEQYKYKWLKCSNLHQIFIVHAFVCAHARVYAVRCSLKHDYVESTYQFARLYVANCGHTANYGQ